MLRFWGRGSAFRPENNSAFFVDGSDLVLLDLSMSAFHKMIQTGLDPLIPDPGKDTAIRHIYVLVTHTHSDHIGGIPMLIHYAYYVWGKLPVTVAAPSEEVAEDLHFYLDRLEGCDREAYEITTADTLTKWAADIIPTKHTPQLDGRCFGYHLLLNGRNVIYTGDTATLKPFAPYLQKDAILYTEIASFKSPVHLSLEDTLEELKALTEQNIEVFLMHLDDETTIQAAIEGTKVRLAELYP